MRGCARGGVDDPAVCWSGVRAVCAGTGGAAPTTASAVRPVITVSDFADITSPLFPARPKLPYRDAPVNHQRYRHPCMGLGKSRGKGEANCYAMAANSMVGFFVRPRPFLRPDRGGAGAPRAAAVKAGRRPPPQAARSGLDDGAHGAKLSGRDDGSRDKRQDVILDWAVCDECANTASPCIRFGRETRYPNLSCTGESKAQNRRDPSERAGC